MGMNQYADLSTVPYISQYVPTNVQFLYNVAKDQVEQQDKVRKEVNDQLKEWAKFHSLSDIDNQNYYDIAINPVKDLIAQGAANPELMKTAAYRNALTNQISNVDYAALSQLETNAKNFDTRAKVIADMKSKGLYADWMDDQTMTPEGMTKWDTLKSGIMSDLSPMMFKDLRTIGDPYVEGLKPRFYAKVDPVSGTKKPFTDWSAITADDIQREFNANLTDIKATPQGEAWYNRIAAGMKQRNPNVTESQVDQQFVKMLAAQQQKRIVSSPIVDQVGLAMWQKSVDASMQRAKLAAANTAKAAKSGQSSALGFTSISAGNASEYLKSKAQSALNSNPELISKNNHKLQMGYDALVTEYDRIAKANPNSEFAKAYTSLKQQAQKAPQLASNRDAIIQAIAQGAMGLQQQLYSSGKNITEDKTALGKLQYKLNFLGKMENEVAESGMNYLLQNAAEKTADMIHNSIGDGYTTGAKSGRSTNAFTQFDFNFDAGRPITKDNATKSIIDHTYHELFTPLQGGTADLVSSTVAKDLVGKPLDRERSLSPAQFLEQNQFFSDYWAEAMRTNAERVYKNYNGGDKAQKIAQASNVSMHDVIYDRQKSPWHTIGRSDSWRNDMNLEKHTKKGYIPSPTITKVNGYCDTGDGQRVYDVTVELPLKFLVDDHENGFNMSWHYDGNTVEKQLKGFGYDIQVRPGEGKDGDQTNKYVQWHMAVPVTNDDMQQYYNDAMMSKQMQTSKTRNSINYTDDMLLQLDGYTPGTGWE